MIYPGLSNNSISNCLEHFMCWPVILALLSTNADSAKVLDAGGTQTNNPRYARFAFHAAGMKDGLNWGHASCSPYQMGGVVFWGLHRFRRFQVCP